MDKLVIFIYSELKVDLHFVGCFRIELLQSMIYFISKHQNLNVTKWCHVYCCYLSYLPNHWSIGRQTEISVQSRPLISFRKCYYLLISVTDSWPNMFLGPPLFLSPWRFQFRVYLRFSLIISAILSYPLPESFRNFLLSWELIWFLSH